MHKERKPHVRNILHVFTVVSMTSCISALYGFCGEVPSTVNYQGKTLTLIAAQAAKSGTDTVARTQKFGYSDYGQPTLEALLKGEVDLSSVPGRVWSAALPFVNSGEIIPIFQDGVGPNLDRAGNVPQIMNLSETYKSLYGKDPDLSDPVYRMIKTYLGLTLQTPLWVHRDAPPEMIKILQFGIEKMLYQPEFRQVALDLVGSDSVGSGFIYGDKADKFLEEFFSRRDEIDRIIKATGTSGG